MAQKVIWKYGVNAYGIKKRGRKADFHTDGDRGGLDQAESPDQARAIELAKKWAAENMREVHKLRATAHRWELNDDGTETWQPFTETHNFSWPVDL